MTGSIDPRLLDVLVCPACHGDLTPEPTVAAPTQLVCASASPAGCGLRYPVVDGVPILLTDEATHG